jgi:hypothetical protein
MTRIFNPHESDNVPLLEFERGVAKGEVPIASTMTLSVTGASRNLNLSFRKAMFPVPKGGYYLLREGSHTIGCDEV